MRRSCVAGLALLTIALVWASVAEAQQRQQPREREARPSIIDQVRSRMSSSEKPGASASAAADGVGAISGDERFLRGARGASDFVGADSREGGFVGGQSATDGKIQSAIEGELVREAVDPAINRIRSLPQLQTGMYAPRLRLGFSPAILPAPAIESAATQRLSGSSTIRTTGPLEVSMAGRTAILRGAVASEHQKQLAGLILLFEPGISRVENELAVASPESDSTPPEIEPAPQ